MYRNYAYRTSVPNKHIVKLWMIMRLTTVILILTLMLASATGFAQRIRMSRSNVPLKSIMNEIKAKTGFNFILTDNLLKKAKAVSINVKDAELKDVLKKVFDDQPLTYVVDSKAIVVRPCDCETLKNSNVIDEIMEYLKIINVYGKVVNENNKPIEGAILTIKGGKGLK